MSEADPPTAPAALRVVFFGTPGVAVPALEALVVADDVDVVAVVTNPDRPRGRSRTPQPPPVKRAARRHDLRVLQPERPAQIVDELRELTPAACAVVAYGALLPPSVLAAGGAGFVNLHFSLLPRWRGAAPVQHAIRAGDRTTGVTTFVLDEGMDTGPILRTLEVPLEHDVTAGQLLEDLAARGAPLLLESIRALVAGETPRPQPETGATLAPKITPEDVRIDWRVPAEEIHALVRSANPAPGAHTTFRGDRLKVWGARPVGGSAPPGEVVEVADDGPTVGTAAGRLVLTEVQPAGKGRVRGRDFANGYQPVGETLGS